MKLTTILFVLAFALMAGSAAWAEGLIEAAVEDAEAVTEAAVDTSAHAAGTATSPSPARRA